MTSLNLWFPTTKQHSNLNKDNIASILAKKGVSEALIKDVMNVLSTAEFARYAPSQASDALEQLYEMTVDAIGKMENTIKK